MKNIFILIFTLTMAYTEPLNIDGLLDIKDISINMKEGLSKGLRQVTNTRTPEEECNREWWKYFKKSNHIISIITSENRKLEKVLYKHHVNHRLITKQKTRNVKVDIDKLRKHSCSQKYFDQIVQKETIIKKEKLKNETLRELLKMNNVIVKKEPLFILDKNKITEKKEKASAKKDLKLQMKKAMSDVD